MTSILVLDDRSDNRDLMVAVLGPAGYDVIEAVTGADALQIIRAAAPDLIIADILMPQMDGYEFVRSLRSDPATADLRVMFCTATYAEDEVRALAAACGVTQILFKPCEPDQIYAAVTDALAADVAPVGPMAPEDYPEHLRVLNGKLIEKITQLEESERRGAEAMTLLETLQSSAPVGFGFIDREFRTVRVNDMMAEINGIPAAEQIGRTTEEMVPDMWPKVEPVYRQVLETGEPIVNVEVEGDAATGERRCWLSSFYPVRLDEEVIGIGLVVIDITERRRAEDLRAVVMDNMAEGVLVSDTHGALVYMNDAASEMLGWREEELRGKPVHQTIHFQRADGSPFPMEECAVAQLHIGGETVKQADDAFTRKDGAIIPVACSAAPLRTGELVTGSVIVFRDTTQERAEQLLAQRELDALAWVGRIRDALEENRLVLYAQPIVPLNGGQGSDELLIRMVSRTGELIAPGSFLPAAEKYGLIGEIDRWVIGQAAALAATGRHVEVNLSARSLSDLGMIRLIETRFRERSVDPSLVVFEITESALMVNLEAGEAFVKGLVALGSRVALDDFGTGFGSFTYLKRLPIHFLKIDIDFVRDLLISPANQHLVRATVGLARDFGYKTIAEGVEDAGTLALLTDLGVDLVQGFFLGRPAPIAH